MGELIDTLESLAESKAGEAGAATLGALRMYSAQMLETARSLGVGSACQELYDAFVADDRGSRERRLKHVWLARLVDGLAGTLAVGPDGTLYNEPELPDPREAAALLEARGGAEGMGIWHVVALARDVVDGWGASASTSTQYLRVWREFAGHLRRSGAPLEWSAGLASDWASETSGLPAWRRKARARAMSVIAEVAEAGSCGWRKEPARRPGAPTAGLESVRGLYAADLAARNLSPSTVAQRDRALRRLLESSGADEPGDLSSLGRAEVASAVEAIAATCGPRSMATMLPALRDAIGFLSASGLCEPGLAGLVMTPRTRRSGVATYLSAEDEASLVASLADGSLRDRAMVLLALRLGLRDSDVCGLTFGELDLARDRICLVQQKTGRPLTLPLTAEVGNAILDYAEGERPEGARGCAHVFVRSCAPHARLSSMYHVCRRALERAGVHAVGGDALGPHLLRRTHARRMLEARVPIDLIGESLGHGDPDSDKAYLPLDEAGLVACALGLDGIADPSWCEGRRSR